MKPGGTEGGNGSFFAGLGLILAAAGLYMLFDSVHVHSAGAGLVSGIFGAGGAWYTTSMGVIFLPFLAGIAILFYDAEIKLGWGFLWVGIAIIAVEILSRLRFEFNMKTSHLMLILGLVAAGVGLVMRGLKEDKHAQKREDESGKQ